MDVLAVHQTKIDVKVDLLSILLNCVGMCVLDDSQCTSFFLWHSWSQSKPSMKLKTAKAIFWINPSGTAWKRFFFCNKTFFFKIESWNFEFHETLQNFNSFSLFRKLLFSISCLIESKFVIFHEILFQKFQLWSCKTKKFYF